MLGSTVLEVAIGFVFCYASIALIASSVYEAGASFLKLRASTLLDGVKDLLNDQSFTGLARDIYNHALVNPQDPGTTPPGGSPEVTPSYIEPRHFALALIDSIEKTPGVVTDLKAKIDGLGDAQLRLLLQGMLARSQGKMEDFEAALANWFDAAMDRVSGNYKRKAQLFTFIIALACAVLFNVDSLRLFSVLWAHPASVAEVTIVSKADTADLLTKLTSLPIGWKPRPDSVFAGAGWLVTASSALFGASFWFDLLQRLTRLRGTGEKPSGF
jgi:hypothetical protein